MTENEISYKVIGAIYKVYNELGPGLLESVYEAALCYQLRKDGLKVENQVKLSVIYDGHVLPVDLRLDVLVEDKVIVELKSVTEMIDLACAPAWMTIDKDALKITFDRIPEREELDPEIKEQLVIEYYSK